MKGQIDEYTITRLFLTGLPVGLREKVIRAKAIDPNMLYHAACLTSSTPQRSRL